LIITPERVDFHVYLIHFAATMLFARRCLMICPLRASHAHAGSSLMRYALPRMALPRMLMLIATGRLSLKIARIPCYADYFSCLISAPPPDT